MSDNWKRFWAWFTVGVMIVGLLTCIGLGTIEALGVLHGQ